VSWIAVWLHVTLGASAMHGCDHDEDSRRMTGAAVARRRLSLAWACSRGAIGKVAHAAEAG
jgi:hypothetical protein